MSKQEQDQPTTQDIDAFLAGRTPDLSKTVTYYTVDLADEIRDAVEQAEQAHLDGDEESARKHAAEAKKLSATMSASREVVRLRPASADVLWDLNKRDQAGDDTRFDTLAATVVEPEWSADDWRKFAKAPGLGSVFFEILGAANTLNYSSAAAMPDFSRATSDLLAELDSGKS